MRQTVAGVVVAAGLAMSATTVYAQTNNIIVPRITNSQLNTLQSRQQRQNFQQQQQQFNRQIDSLSSQQRQQRPNVPVMKPTCSPQKASLGC